MSSGLLALLDDIAAIAKTAAASLDDVAVQAVDASGKAAGVVIDDAAVTPKYVIGLSPKREVPIVWNIAKGSIKNKVIILLPALMLLGWQAPWSIGPLLAIGGLFLCFEGYEKLHDMVHSLLHKSDAAEMNEKPIEISPEELERMRTSGAIRTDFILSAEIMAISFNQVKDKSIMEQLIVLLVVAVLITGAVYGFVALVLKADDIGLHLAKDKFKSWTRAFGRSLIFGVPYLLTVLGVVGTLAMLWVGGQLLIHSIPILHHTLEHWVSALKLSGFWAWIFEATVGLIFGIIVGFAVVMVLDWTKKMMLKRKASIL